MIRAATGHYRRNGLSTPFSVVFHFPYINICLPPSPRYLRRSSANLSRKTSLCCSSTQLDDLDMKQQAPATFFLLISSLAAICNAASARSARAVNKIGFSKRQNQWIGGAALYASACPSDLQSCGTTSAQAWCCPKGTVCRSDYCCPNCLSAVSVLLIMTFL